MPTISAFDPGVRYDDADKEAEAQRQAAQDFMFRARLQQQAAANQYAMQNADINSRNALGFADIADRGAARAADLDKALAVEGSYKQRANDAAAAQLAGLQGQKDVVGLQGQNQVNAIRAGQEPELGRLAFDREKYNDQSPAFKAAAQEAAIQSQLKGRVAQMASSYLDGGGAPTAPTAAIGGVFAPQSNDPMGLYPSPTRADGGGAPTLSPAAKTALIFGALGQPAPVDPDVADNEAIKKALIANLSSPDATVRGNAEAALRKLRVNVPDGAFSGGNGLDTGAIRTVGDAQAFVKPDVDNLRAYAQGITGWTGSGNADHLLSAAQSIGQKLDTIKTPPAVKAQILTDLYNNIVSDTGGRGTLSPWRTGLLDKLKNVLGVGMPTGPIAAPYVRPDAQ